ncbi:DUF4240 domain-containing protein [Streptomyces scabiei]|uniref:DUF4240 domain-containing protein n=1 Tax=Streptomyces scabiei TaxID=1930 RepID=UPI0007660AEE|nr:DUF4240 domain-containing protein [Streptomyces scabiei]
MDDEIFWNMIESCRRQTRDPDERLAWLRGQIALRPELDAVRFQISLDRVLAPTFTWDVWAAADRIMGWCSDDSFFYFRLWLVGLGRDMFERVAREPDALAEAPEVQRLAGRSPRSWTDHEWPEWEELDYVAGQAFEDVTGKTHDDFHDAIDAQNFEDPEPKDPAGERWDVNRGEETARRLPRLSALFPVSEAK